MANTAAQTNALVGNVDYTLVPCALVLEDEPVGEDSRLRFESFPESLNEAYAVNAYREIAADRMPQPGFVAYRGGNWSSFSLELKFRAGQRPGSTKSLNQLSVNDIEEVLLEMERKVRWCQALGFPLERTARGIIERVEQSVSLIGGATPALQNVNLSQLTRNDPPMVFVVFGSFLVLRCYLTNYDIRWEAPFHPITAQPYGAVVTLTFQRLEKSYPTWQSIRNSAGQAQSSPLIPRIQGNIPLRVETAETLAAQRQAANARVLADNQNFPSSLSIVNG